MKRMLTDYITLTKPRITMLCVFMTLGGMALAPGSLTWAQRLGCLVGAALSVASANTLNMVWEKDSDKNMRRTRMRPLPSGRIGAFSALVFGLALGFLSVAILWWANNALTATLALFAIVSYVCVYTPLKRRTPQALAVGAIPGAIPPLLGWTAVTADLSKGGVGLFLVMVFWQIPHFLAIAIYSREDYANAGIQAVPVVRSARNTRVQTFVYSILLMAITLALFPMGLGGSVYLLVAVALGVWFSRLCFQGLQNGDEVWARKVFRASLLHLPILTMGLVLDQLVPAFSIHGW